MKRTISFSLALVAAAAIAGAQTPATQPPSSPAAQRPTAQSTADASKITVTGCLKPGASAGSFVLEAARPASAGAGAQAPGAVGTAGTGASVMAKTYSLATKAGDELSKHLNHRMEVIGSVSPRRADPSMGGAAQSGWAAGSGAKPAGSTAAGSGSPSGQQGTSAQPSEILTVESFKMVAATCS